VKALTHLIKIYNELYESGAFVFDRRLPFENAGNAAAVVALEGSCAIYLDTEKLKTTAEEAVAVAHKAGHIMTGSTHYVNSPFDLIYRHEYRANKWAIKKLIPKDELDRAVVEGRSEVWELAEFFGVTENFMELAIAYYKRIY
jgi:hypothetical protein